MKIGNLGFRIVSHKFVAIGSGPKAITYGKCVGEGGGICHASKQKLWWSMQAFGVPKGSPIHASIIYQKCGNGLNEKIFPLYTERFQHGNFVVDRHRIKQKDGGRYCLQIHGPEKGLVD